MSVRIFSVRYVNQPKENITRQPSINLRYMGSKENRFIITKRKIYNRPMNSMMPVALSMTMLIRIIERWLPMDSAAPGRFLFFLKFSRRFLPEPVQGNCCLSFIVIQKLWGIFPLLSFLLKKPITSTPSITKCIKSIEHTVLTHVSQKLYRA